MSRTRRDELLTLATKAFEDCMSPFENSWLVKNEVTADECMDLSQAIAFCIEWYMLADISSAASEMKLKRWALWKMYKEAAKEAAEEDRE